MTTRDDVLGVVHLFPTLMGTYGDAGNVTVLAHRSRSRGIAVEVVTVGPSDPIPRHGDLYVVGGGEDHGQVVAARRLTENNALRSAADGGAVVFAVCAGLQILGESFEVGDGRIEEGAGLLDLTTRRREPRAVGEVWGECDPVLTSALPPPANAALPPLTGYENHGGGSKLGPGVRPLARVTSGIGNGSGGPGGDSTEGAWVGKILATYLHGPVLARNPLLADLLLTWVTGHPLAPLPTPFAEELRTERRAYVTSGRLSASAADTNKPTVIRAPSRFRRSQGCP